jgi:hypothetical protein
VNESERVNAPSPKSLYKTVHVLGTIYILRRR